MHWGHDLCSLLFSWLYWHVTATLEQKETMLYLARLNSNTEQQCLDWTWNWDLCLDFSLNTTAATQKGHLESLLKVHKALRNGEIASADQDLLIFCRLGSSGSSACPLPSGSEGKGQGPLKQLLEIPEAMQEHTLFSHSLCCLQESCKKKVYFQEHLLSVGELVCYP